MKVYTFESVNEALIASYDINKCKANLMKRFPEITDVAEASENPYYVPYYRKKGNDNTGFFIISASDISNIESIEHAVTVSYGWFISHVRIHDYNNDISELFIRYPDGFISERYGGMFDFIKDLAQGEYMADIFIEAKFSVSADVKEDELYHLTDACSLTGIIKDGLVPKSKGNFPERLYFGKSKKDIRYMMKGRYEYPVMIKLRRDTGERLDFFTDPRNPSAVYTYMNVSPESLFLLTGHNESVALGMATYTDIAKAVNYMNSRFRIIRESEILSAYLHEFIDFLKGKNFKQVMDEFGYSLKIITGANVKGEPSGSYADPTETSYHKMTVNVASEYIKKGGFSHFQDLCAWSVHEAAHIWLSGTHASIDDSGLYPSNFSELFAYCAQFIIRPDSVKKVIRQKTMHAEADVAWIYGYIYEIAKTLK